MKQYQYLFLFLLCMSPRSLEAETKFNPEFYAFQNGVQFSDLNEEIKALKTLGYAGISQIKAKGGAAKIAKQVAAYDAAGLKVLSIYLDVNDKPIAPDIVKPLANREAMIELTVRKSTDPAKTIEAVRKTAEMAKKMKIKVGLYPHHHFTVATFAEALAMAKKINHPNLGVIFNVCHFLKNEDIKDMEKLLTVAADAKQLFAVTTNGARINGKDWSQLIQPLDQGDFPQETLLLILKQLNFQGPVGLQCYNIKGDKRENLARSIKAWREVLGKVNQVD